MLVIFEFDDFSICVLFRAYRNIHYRRIRRPLQQALNVKATLSPDTAVNGP